MSESSIDALNDITKLLIDSHKGYEKAAEVADDSYAHKAEFRRRAAQRAALISEFQARVRLLGGEAETDGGMLGKLHRGAMEFASLFQSDEKAALSAIDDGEEHLADKIESELMDDDVDVETRALLQRAHAEAKAGERFADLMDSAT